VGGTVSGMGWYNAIRPVLDRFGRFLNQLLRDFLKEFSKSLPSSLLGKLFGDLVNAFLDWIRSFDPVCIKPFIIYIVY
jgi:hypothetical protein